MLKVNEEEDSKISEIERKNIKKMLINEAP
jgi:hypothetical protein